MSKYNAFYLLLSLTVIGTTWGLTLQQVEHGDRPVESACKALYSTFPTLTAFSNQTQYTENVGGYWSASSAELQPACAFSPACAENLGTAVKIMKSFNSSFAMKGGGHMPIYNSNTIGPFGVLITSSNFRQMKLSPDTESLFFGPGNHWSDVYKFLEPFELLVAGGRLGVVGIPGFITGGGISFLSWQHGWSSSTIKSMRVVLASGDVVIATSQNEYADLLWALRGGGNSFALVTEFEMKTFPAPIVTVGQATYGSGSSVKQKWLALTYNFAIYGANTDFKATVTPISNWGSIFSEINYSGMRFYNGNNSAPAALQNFTSPVLPGTNDTFAPRTMKAWCDLMDPAFAQSVGFRERFHIVSTFADIRAMEIVHDTYYGLMQEALMGRMGKVWIGGLTAMPISKQFFVASTVNGGDPMGLKPSDGPRIWFEINLSFGNKQEYDDLATEFLNEFDRRLKENLAADGIKRPAYLYLNDADKGQPVFEGYPSDNLQRLQSIRARYDPDMVLTRLMPGGWKVANV